MKRTPTGTRPTAADRLRAAERTGDLAEVDTTQPLDQRPTGTAVVKADTNGHDLAIPYRDLIEVVEHAKAQEFDGQNLVDLYSLLDRFRRQLDQSREHAMARTLVPADLIGELPKISQEIERTVTSWALQRGLANGSGEAQT
jgi:hypothetical protein